MQWMTWTTSFWVVAKKGMCHVVFKRNFRIIRHLDLKWSLITESTINFKYEGLCVTKYFWPLPWRLSLSSLVVNHAWLTELLLSLTTTGWEAGMIDDSWVSWPAASAATAADNVNVAFAASWAERGASWPVLSMVALVNVWEATSW